MHYTTLGSTGLRVSVAGLGCGGNSQLGLGAGKTAVESVAVVRTAVDLGVNFLDTAAAYGTEEIVGKAIAEIGRDHLVISSKALIRQEGRLRSAAEIIASLEDSLRRLRIDCLDVFHLHAVVPETYEHALNELAPALMRERERGKFRFLGITESPPQDPSQQMLQRAVTDPCWSVMMVGFHMLNQKARERVFPQTAANGIGTLLMFVVRNIFSAPGQLTDTLAELAAGGQLETPAGDRNTSLDFLLHGNGARSIVDAAYRYARHEPGADVVLFGTGNPAHVKSNVESILRPPLPADDNARLAKMFGHLEGIGLDLPNRVTGGQV